jgi:hypothetical protein
VVDHIQVHFLSVYRYMASLAFIGKVDDDVRYRLDEDLEPRPQR